MPNGFYGTKEEWEKIDGPLKQLDSFFKLYAQQYGFKLSKYYHNEAERSFSLVGRDRIKRDIQVYVVDKKKPSYKMWAVAWEDRNEGRYWKQTIIKPDICSPLDEQSMRKWLEEARIFLNNVKRGDLEPT